MYHLDGGKQTEGEKDLYGFARVRDQAGKDVQQVRVLKDADGNVLTNGERVQRSVNHSLELCEERAIRMHCLL